MRPDRFEGRIAVVTGAASGIDVDGGIMVSNGSSYDEYFSVRS